MSIFHRSGGKGFQKLPSLKYYNVQKWESRFTFEHDVAKSTHHIQKCFKQKLLIIKLRTKKSVDARVCLPQEWR